MEATALKRAYATLTIIAFVFAFISLGGAILGVDDRGWMFAPAYLLVGLVGIAALVFLKRRN